ncbi:MAG TPA: MG2 domain-containing protein, partial [Chthoniobacteraceae bacterium]|nr:MG2 domain-containing protein [Chthoniobacteraceae bacterium]
MNRLSRLFERIFGVVMWSPPVWLVPAGRWVRGHRLLTFLVVVAGVGTAGGGAWLYQWYKHRPPPHYATVQVGNIPVTPLWKGQLVPPRIGVHFGESAAPLRMIGKRVAAGVTLTPATGGYWRWDSDRDLVFVPAQDWPADTQYHISLDRKAISRHVLLARYGFDIKSAEFRGAIRKYEFYQDPKDPTMKKVVCTLEFTHSVTAGDVERNLSLTMLGGSQVFPKGAPTFSVDMGIHDRIVYIHTARLDLPEQEDFMKIVLGKGLQTTQGGAGIKEELAQTTRIPNKVSFFKVDRAEGTIVKTPDGEPEQFIILTTTAETAPEDVAKGLEIYLLPHRARKVADGDAEDTDSRDNHDGDAEDNEEEQPGNGAREWDSPSEVDQKTLNAAKPVSFTLMPSRTETAKQITFKIHVPQTGCLYVRLKKGTKAVGDFELSNDYNALVPVPAPPVEISIQGKGGVLALSGERKISIVSRGVEQIEYTISRVPADEINHLVSQTEGNFDTPDFLNGSFDENDIARISREKETIIAPDRFKPNYSTFDFGTHLGPATDGGSALQGLFFLEVRALDPKTRKYIADVDEKRFILVTDLGILVKQNADDSRDVFVQALAARAPMAAATVQILARNGVADATGTTGTDGRVSFAPVGKVTREREPIAIVVRNGNDVAFIPYDRDDRKVDFSRFDIGGDNITSGAELTAFVFTERGVYRPGDTIHIGYAIKQKDWQGNLAGLPVETEIVDARNSTAQVRRVSVPAGGFGEFTYQTRYESPTGDYGINIYLVKDGKRGDLIGSDTVLVKEFLPDRMKINVHLSKEISKGWITPDDVSAKVTLTNLYGTPASKRRITGKVNLSPAGFYFDEYPDYTF